MLHEPFLPVDFNPSQAPTGLHACAKRERGRMWSSHVCTEPATMVVNVLSASSHAQKDDAISAWEPTHTCVRWGQVLPAVSCIRARKATP